MFELTAKSPLIVVAPVVSGAMPELETVKVSDSVEWTASLRKANWPGASDTTGMFRLV